MMVLAVTLHNIPEGMAVGVMYAGFLAGNAQITAASALVLSLGIAIQNFPEGAIISMPLRAEGVKNASFRRGNAVKLDFPDESFDAVTSNYVYHNIAGEDKQALLLETLRVLKKGGTFAIHDLMSPRRYGDMQAFVQKLRNMGYERVELMDTTDGSFMTPKEAGRLMLRGSTLLVGRK